MNTQHHYQQRLLELERDLRRHHLQAGPRHARWQARSGERRPRR